MPKDACASNDNRSKSGSFALIPTTFSLIQKKSSNCTSMDVSCNSTTSVCSAGGSGYVRSTSAPVTTSSSRSSCSPPSYIRPGRRALSTTAMRSLSQRSNSNKQNTTFLMANRSDGSTVKKVIPAILKACEGDKTQVPEEECFVLAKWAKDNYYKVVIAGNGGIQAIICAMETFPQSPSLQESCCDALANLCQGSESNKFAASGAGAVQWIVTCMKLFPTRVSVQSAACAALRNLPIIAEVETGSDLISVFEHAKAMCLHPSHRRTAEHLLAITRQQMQQLDSPR